MLTQQNITQFQRPSITRALVPVKNKLSWRTGPDLNLGLR